MNRLTDSRSPYLRQHAHNPVDWYPWGEEAFAEAKRRNVPVFLSVGYASCHWCHVMAHESFENEETARYLNENFVSVKVDKEELPAVDEVYMQAVQALSGSGGWPMSVFLNHEQKAFFGGTYYPPSPAYGRPSFRQVLNALTQTWKTRRAEVDAAADELTQRLKNLDLDAPTKQGIAYLLEASYLPNDENSSAEEIRLFLRHEIDELLSRADSHYGGFGQAPKFPMPSVLDFLVRWALRSSEIDRSSDAEIKNLANKTLSTVGLTLAAMAQGGLHDQLGGGFHRYSTDEYWLVPHFEKMLYDNAQLLPLYAQYAVMSSDPSFRHYAEATAAWLFSQENKNTGLLFSSVDADSEGREGAFYLWTEDELKLALVDIPTTAETLALSLDAKTALAYTKEVFGLGEQKHLDDAWILRQFRDENSLDDLRKNFALDPKKETELFAEIKKALLKHRAKRQAPAVDEKEICSWNALAISGLARAGRLLGKKDWLEAAEKIARAVLKASELETALTAESKIPKTETDLLAAESSLKTQALGASAASDVTSTETPLFEAAKLKRILGDPNAGRAHLEDYSFLADAFLELYLANGDTSWFKKARALVDYSLKAFANPHGEAENKTKLYDLAHDDPDSRRLPYRPRELQDNALPSAHSKLAHSLLKLAELCPGEGGYAQRAEEILGFYAAKEQSQGFFFCLGLSALLEVVNPRPCYVLVGKADAPEFAASLENLRKNPDPGNLWVCVTESHNQKELPPAAEAKTTKEGKTTLYACRGGVCSTPLVLTQALKT